MEQISLFDVETEFLDETFDRADRQYPVPKWMHYERCENCTRWNKLDVSQQPPAGWHILGYCAAHMQRTDKGSYCGRWEDNRRMSNGGTIDHL
jgi:hypothetical protein